VSAGWENDDDDLLAALGEAMREEDDVPPRVLTTGKGLFALYSLEADLAALEAGDKQLVGARSAATAVRELDLTSGDLTIHLEISARAISGQVVPPQAGEVDLQTPAGRPLRAEVDELGWFTVSPAPREDFRLLFLGAGGARALTDWIPA
jgi:hypothetical protein